MPAAAGGGAVADADDERCPDQLVSPGTDGLLVFETAYNKLKFYVSNWSLDVQQHVLNVSLCSENSGLKQHLFEFVRLKYEMIEGSWEDIYATSQTKYEGGKNKKLCKTCYLFRWWVN